MQLSDIDYELPEDRIAQVPCEPRDSARLLVDRGAEAPSHVTVAELEGLLRPGDVVVVNDTRVMTGRLDLRRHSGGEVEVLLIEPIPGGAGRWEALIRPARRIRAGEVLEIDGSPAVRVGGRTPGGATFSVEVLDPEPSRFIERNGKLPLPPYIRGYAGDPERYQTVYSRDPRSAAAPTAGLHFTGDLLARLGSSGIATATVELVVGLDTFRPVTAQDPRDHDVHTEAYSVPEETVAACARARRVIAVGTTTARALESAAATGMNSGRTSLLVTREHQWRTVDVLLTNFHLPRTSLILMVDSFVGPRWRDLYGTALAEGYRFGSFGDAMLLDRHAGVR